MFGARPNVDAASAFCRLSEDPGHRETTPGCTLRDQLREIVFLSKTRAPRMLAARVCVGTAQPVGASRPSRQLIQVALAHFAGDRVGVALARHDDGDESDPVRGKANARQLRTPHRTSGETLPEHRESDETKAVEDPGFHRVLES
eukprot:916246-Rhodomonas_salina.2